MLCFVLPTCNRYQMARYLAYVRRYGDAGIIEISGLGSYDLPGWRSPLADRQDNVITLVRDRKRGEIGTAELKRRLWQALDERRTSIAALALMGWGIPEANLGQLWALRNHVPCIMFSESQTSDRSRSSWGEWVKRRITAGFASAVVGGRPHADYLVQLGMSPHSIFPGYDVVDNEYFAAGAAKVRGQSSVVRGQLGLPQNYFLASARFIEKKNLSRLIEAYAEYRKMWNSKGGIRNRGTTAVSSVNSYGPDSAGPSTWDLVLLGDGPLRSSLESQISRLGLQASVLLAGAHPYEDLPAFFGLAGVFVHASTAEQWGLVVNEAMAAGLPVLVSRACGCAELVHEGENGHLFDPLNAQELANLMLKISDSRFPIPDFGNAGRRIIHEWSPDFFAENLRRAYETALAAPPSGNSWITRGILWGMTKLRTAAIA